MELWLHADDLDVNVTASRLKFPGASVLFQAM
jgi:hypothetical protein